MTEPVEMTMAHLEQMSEDVRSVEGPGRITKTFNETLIAEFRATAGKLSGEFARSRFLLLTTTGARSARQRVTPLAYIPIDERIVIIASMGGAPTSPAWYHNLVTNPEVSVELGAENYQARAVVTAGADREALFDRVKTKLPIFAEYERRTERVIPVVELVRLNP